jgi:hypothetical protein
MNYDFWSSENKRERNSSSLKRISIKKWTLLFLS